ncbi:NAD-dependent epimerase/dehydratase family protein [Roseibium marinum]|nr:NAD(P)-dependent oxidoreductase [Roseibium marinum]
MTVNEARLLVTGSSGRIGSAICDAAGKRYRTIGLDITPGHHTTHVTDLLRLNELPGMPVDAVIHAAGLHAPHVGLASDSQFTALNVLATERLAKAAKASGVPEFVFTSTTALYGVQVSTGQPARWIDETSEPCPRTIYHRTKLEAEIRLRRLAAPGFRVTIIRLGRCFPEPADQMIIHRICRGVDERDAANAHLAALGRTGGLCETVIVSGDTPFTKSDCVGLREDAETVIALRRPDIVTIFNLREWKLPRTIDRVYDNAHAKRLLRWAPRYGDRSILEELATGSSRVLPGSMPG